MRRIALGLLLLLLIATGTLHAQSPSIGGTPQMVLVEDVKMGELSCPSDTILVVQAYSSYKAWVSCPPAYFVAPTPTDTPTPTPTQPPSPILPTATPTPTATQEVSMALVDSLVAYWSLADVNDAHGSNHLTNNNTATFVAGKIGNAVDLELGSSQSLSITDNAALSMGDIDFTIACWVKMESKPATDMEIVSKTDVASSQREYRLQWLTSSDRFRFIASGDGVATTTILASTFGAPSLATWYFLVAQHDATANTIAISVNNGTANSAAHTTGVFNGTSTFRIGATLNTPALFFDGLVDECGIWKRVLSGAELTELYNSGSGRDYAYIAGAGALTISPNAIASTATIYQPTVTPGAIAVAPNAIASTEVVYEPTLTFGVVTVSPDLIVSTAQVFAPTAQSGAIDIAPDAIASTAVVYEPTVSIGVIVISPDAIPSGAAVYQPTVSMASLQSIEPNFIASGSVVYQIIVALYTASIERTYAIPVEDRSFGVAAESRLYEVS